MILKIINKIKKYYYIKKIKKQLKTTKYFIY